MGNIFNISRKGNIAPCLRYYTNRHDHTRDRSG